MNKFKLLFFSFLFFNRISSQNIDSLKKIISVKNNDTLTVSAFHLLGQLYIQTNIDTANFYLMSAKKIATKALSSNQNQTVKTKLLRELSEVVNDLGVLKNYQGNVGGALENYFEALKICEQIDDKIGKLSALNNIGIIYYGQGDFKKAEENFLESITIARSINDSIGLASSYNYLGYLYGDKGFREKALNSFSIALKYTNPNNLNQLGYLYNDIGVIYHQKKDLEQALKSYTMSLKLREQIGSKQGLAGTYINIGKVYIDKKEFSKAETYIAKSMALAKEIGYPSSIKMAAEQLKIIYKALGRKDEALEMYELFIQMKDSLTNEETRKASIKSQLKYEYDKKEFQILATAKAEKDKIELKAAEDKKRQDLIIYAVLLGLMIVVVFSFFIYRSLQQNKKKNIIIAKQKEIVEHKQKEVMDSIKYAKRIQMALLPNEKYIEKNIRKLKKNE